MMRWVNGGFRLERGSEGNVMLGRKEGGGA